MCSICKKVSLPVLSNTARSATLHAEKTRGQQDGCACSMIITGMVQFMSCPIYTCHKVCFASPAGVPADYVCCHRAGHHIAHPQEAGGDICRLTCRRLQKGMRWENFSHCSPGSASSTSRYALLTHCSGMLRWPITRPLWQEQQADQCTLTLQAMWAL